ncbi:hypothetical protein [Pedobacter insulae]|uniref:TolB-like 6-blade propeller-like n=1 Tax=Pedobacter insulae TaxID=414048 RepID=A0A1I2ZJD2_9SPHI|nr:hypothetical protein [Pedobacter insulae]SFH37696.1 hypothetical protein SAMN04489864_11058 [Pedobacter insulae]
MKKKLSIILIIAVVILVITSIFLYNVVDKRHNGFSRSIIKLDSKLDTIIDVANKNYFFHEDQNDDRIILKTFKKCNQLLEIRRLDGILSVRNIEVLPAYNLNTRFSNCTIADSVIFLTNSAGEVLRIKPNGVSEYFKVPGLIFDQSHAISPQTIIVRAIKKYGQIKQREICRIELVTSAVVTASLTLPKQVDGYFCTDGWMRYNKESSSLLYMFYYRGEVLKMDTNLSKISVIKTIDTISTARIITQIHQKHTSQGITEKHTSMRTSRSSVNYFFAMDKNKLFILSALKAENEPLQFIRKKQFIDVYDIKAGKYLYSFSLPFYKGFKIRDFSIDNRKLNALYGNYLISYDIKESQW